MNIVTMIRAHIYSLLLGFLSCLGDFATAGCLLLNLLDYSYCDSLPHVTYGKPSQRGILGKLFDTHRLLGDHKHHASITRLDKLGTLLKNFARSTINFLLDFNKLAGNVGCVTVEYRCISIWDLTRVVEHDHLTKESIVSIHGQNMYVCRNRIHYHTCAKKFSEARGGSFLESPATFPRRISLTDTFFTLKPTLSPGRASGKDSWCISTDLTYTKNDFLNASYFHEPYEVTPR